MTSPVLFLFREDLRLKDNPALRAAIETAQPIMCLFVLDEETEGAWSAGGARKWWLHHSLKSLMADIEEVGASLTLKRGKAEDVVPKIVQEIGAKQVFWTRRYGPSQIEADKTLKEILKSRDIEVKSFNGRLLFEPWQFTTKTGGYYKVFTPFWKNLKANGDIRAAVAGIRKINGLPKESQHSVASLALEELDLRPSNPDWSKGFDPEWSPGEAGAKDRLKRFLDEAAEAYKDDRNRPDKPGTSGLSPHLHHGEISPIQIWHAVKERVAANEIPDDQADVFLSEIAWREFSYVLLYNKPDMIDEEINPKFKAFPWADMRSAKPDLTAWQKGQTGYPIVDAGMRQLWQTGWMHNRVRMIVGSFLVKHLLIDWRYGMEWFWDTLLDADIASNTASWQWIAGCGADAAPYFRIFNPMTQGEKFDPNGDYVRNYVTELANLPTKYLHTPWEAPKDVLKAGGVKLGVTYPNPIVDHKTARLRALDAYQETK